MWVDRQCYRDGNSENSSHLNHPLLLYPGLKSGSLWLDFLARARFFAGICELRPRHSYFSSRHGHASTNRQNTPFGPLSAANVYVHILIDTFPRSVIINSDRIYSQCPTDPTPQIRIFRQRTINEPPNKPIDRIVGIIKSWARNRKIALFGLEVAAVVAVGVPVVRGSGTGFDGL